MAGYNGFSKSNNAIDAEDRGLMTASQLAKVAGQQWNRLKGLKASDVESVVRAREWHHCSKMYNKVNYFDFESLRERGVRARLYRLVIARRAAKAAKPITLEGCKVEWLEWGGTRSHPRAIECSALCSVTFKPGSDQVTAVDGAKTFKKFLSTKGFKITAADGAWVFENPCGGGK